MLRRVGLEINGEKFKIDLKVCNWLKKFSGLMFTRREKAKALLFDFDKYVRMGIHSLFVFFSFYAIWLDEENKIIEIQKVKPWRFLILPSRKYRRLIEIPINKRYEKAISLLGVTTTNSKSLKRVLSSII